MAVTGMVTSIDAREVKTKFGNKPVYDIYVDGNKYSWGFKDPTKMAVTIGAEIEFDFTADKYGPKITENTVKVTKLGTGAASPVAPTAAASSPKPVATAGYRERPFPVPATSGEIAILRQNAVTNARELVSSFPEVFMITEATAPDQLVVTVLNVARSFADYTSGRDAERAVASLTSKMGSTAKDE